MKLHFEEMREPMVGSGLITPEEFEADLKRIDEQDFLMPSPMMWSAWGRKAGGRANSATHHNVWIREHERRKIRASLGNTADGSKSDA
jgi:hypothetical protein